MANKSIQPPSYKTPLVDERGYLTATWELFIKAIFDRVGGTSAPSNSDITALQSDFSTVNPTLNSLQTDVNILQAEVSGLSVGRQL